MFRVEKHPILKVKERPEVKFYFDGKEYYAFKNEIISSALFANGIQIFSYHYKDSSPQGMFCANGQCAQCTVLVDGIPVKSCMAQVKEGMRIQILNGVPDLPDVSSSLERYESIRRLETDVLIIGGGPAGITAAIELGSLGIKVLIVDDKHRLGGKLVLQTHSFFGTVADCYAGTRGIDIATELEEEIKTFSTINVLLNTLAVGVYGDGWVGVMKADEYILIQPQKLLVACGAREKALAFPGCDLPGVYGAGAFQTLVNRDLIKPSQKLFIVGGGNVGLITGYHALQAEINVVGLIEAMPKVGGYKVHADKLKRLGVPIWTSHTILSANGKDKVKSVTIGRVDEKFALVPGTEKTFTADTVLIAVGLNPVDELYSQAKKLGMEVYKAGDAYEIAEASAAIFSGKIIGRRIAKALGKDVFMPEDWEKKWEILKSKPGKTYPLEIGSFPSGIFPIIRCTQEIPCDPCITVCPKDMIKLSGDNVLGIPIITKDECTGCTLCVSVCPGLAITLVDLRKEGESGFVFVPFELMEGLFKIGDEVEAVDKDGESLAKVKVIKVMNRKVQDRTLLVKLEVPKKIATKVAGFKIQPKEISQPQEQIEPPFEDESIICRCERVKAKDIRKLIKDGIRDLNQLKVLRCGMGACGGKTCESLILRLYKEEGIDLCDVTPFTQRPLVAEVSVKLLGGMR
jgi:sarcosine oxidase, subunit alpha